MNTFEDLLKRFLENSATQREKNELRALIQSGKYDEQLKQRVTDIRDSQLPEADTAEEDDELIRQILHAQEDSVPVVPLFRRPVFQVAASLAMIVLALFWFKADDLRSFLAEYTGQPPIEGRKDLIKLPDGTTVILNAASNVEYDKNFGVTNREVTLTGEAYFDVTHDPSKPFIVHSEGVSVEVLGTAFNMNAYPQSKKVKVTVIRGLVQVSHGETVYKKLHPDEEIVVDITNYEFDLHQGTTEEALAWQSNFLILNNVPLSEAATIIGEHFDVKVSFTTPSLKNCRIAGAFINDDSLDHVLTSIAEVLRLTYKVEGKSVVIDGKGCE